MPNDVHVLWCGPPFPEKYKPYLEKWSLVDPTLNLILWDEDMLDEFMETHYPEYLSFYKSLDGYLEITDFARLAILYERGGVYADADIEPMKSLVPFVEMVNKEDVFIVSWEPMEHAVIYGERPILNGLMISSRGHRYPKLLMEYIVRNYTPGAGAVRNTGPVVMRRLYDEYLKIDWKVPHPRSGVMYISVDDFSSLDFPNPDGKHLVFITENWMFIPTTAGYSHIVQTLPPYSHNGKNYSERKMVHVASGSDLEKAYTIHHWKVNSREVLLHQHKDLIIPGIIVAAAFVGLLTAACVKTAR